VFKVVAWFSNLALIPSELDLVIVESSTEEEGSNPRMRRLVYPISISVTPGGLQSEAAEPPVATTANYYNMWTGSIYMWPGPRAPTPHAPAPPMHHAYVAGPPAQWAGH
jgi:hypothetical protein